MFNIFRKPIKQDAETIQDEITNTYSNRHLPTEVRCMLMTCCLQGYDWLAKDVSGKEYVFKNRPESRYDGGIYTGWGVELNLLKTKLVNIGEYLFIPHVLGLVDWTKVPVDSLVIVKNLDDKDWMTMHFAYYEKYNDTPYVWAGGCTSKTVIDQKVVTFDMVRFADVNQLVEERFRVR